MEDELYNALIQVAIDFENDKPDGCSLYRIDEDLLMEALLSKGNEHNEKNTI